jgi:putative ABC transport system substrate-binding protein
MSIASQMTLPSRRRILAAALLLCGISGASALAETVPYRVGIVMPASRGPTYEAFVKGLRDAGLVEGSVSIEARFAEGHADRLPGLVAQLLQRRVDVLVVGSTLGALAAKRATTSVPVVFTGLIDPVAPGIVPSLAHPGGNITGTTFGIGGASLPGKWVEVLKEAVPGLSRVAVLWNPQNPASAELGAEMQRAAKEANVRLDLLDAGDPVKLQAAFAAIGATAPSGLIVANDPFFYANREQMVRFAARRRLPAVYFTKEFVDDGGLLAYGPSVADSYYRAANFVVKILKGAKPADLPVDQPTRYDLAVNVRTAKALGIAIPPGLLVRADYVVN